MRKLPVLLVFAVCIAPCQADPVRLSEPVAVTETHEVFGAPMADAEPGMTLSQLITAAAAHEGRTVRVTTRIDQVCQKKGCFFIAQEGDQVARVTFADYGFFIPTDSTGKQVTLVGTLERRPVSAEERDHYAADLGKEPAANADPFEYRIVATSVMIPRGES